MLGKWRSFSGDSLKNRPLGPAPNTQKRYNRNSCSNCLFRHPAPRQWSFDHFLGLASCGVLAFKRRFSRLSRRKLKSPIESLGSKYVGAATKFAASTSAPVKRFRETQNVYRQHVMRLHGPTTDHSRLGIRILLCGLAIILGATSPAFARDYFVASTPNASDENSGELGEPLRSIGRAISLTEPGDVVLVRSGDYREEESAYGTGVIPVLKSGTRQKPIRIRTGRANRAIVKKFLVQDCQNVIIEGFDVRGTDFSTLPDWQPMPTIVRHRAEGAEPPDFTLPYETRQTQIESEFATYFQQVSRLGFEIGIDLENARRVTIFNNQVAGYFAGIQCRGCQDIVILRNEIKECVNGIFTFYPNGSDSPGLFRSSIRGNAVSQCLDNGIDIRAKSRLILIEENRVRLNGRSHISIQDGANRCNIRFNTLSEGGYYSETMRFPGSSGVSLNDAGGRNIVFDNSVSDQVDYTGIDGNGIIVDFMPEGTRTQIRDNVSNRNMGAGLNLTVSPGTTVTGNVFAQNGWGATERRRGAGIKISRDEDVDNLILRNIFVMNRAAGILSSDTINQQRLVNRNLYFGDGSPLIWDGFNDGDREYCSLLEVQLSTGWELNGKEIPLSAE